MLSFANPGLGFYSLPFIVSFAVSLILTPLVRRFAFKRNIVDAPNELRKVQTSSVPLLGGVAVFAACAVSMAVFGALGTLLFFLALSIGNASKVYPIAGVESMLIFIFAILFLKERFEWHRFLGTGIIVLGIAFVSI